MISVIIPVYKSEPYLVRCLDSVVGQTYRDLEIICVDDGSPDKSIDILKKYAKKDKRIKIIRQKNMGLSDARNNGFAAATGDWVHYLDSDDWIDNDYYEKMLSSATKANADVAVSGFDNENSYNHSINYSKLMTLKTLRERVRGTRVIANNYVWRYLSRRDFLTQNKLFFPTGLRAMEDAFFSLELVRLANKIAVVPNVLYHYALNESSIMHDKTRRKTRNKNMKLSRRYRRNWAWKHGFILDWYLRKFS
ncbi:MAG: glycosyltransferase [Rickettsiales bacterium]|jgi:glycosyltransferase involved in cell wall biosynthesis|nr:glycosyltransferase [Rickettsiales bacterium]